MWHLTSAGLCFYALIQLLGSPAALAAQVAARPADHVFVVMLDGARPDVLRSAPAPTIAALARAGVHYLQARTIYPSQTRVAFISLPTGAYVSSHGMIGGEAFKDAEWRTVSLGTSADPVAAQWLVSRPTIFEEATAAGLTSVYVAMKGYELVGARGATWMINGSKTLDQVAYAARYQATVNGSATAALWSKLRLSRDLLDQALALFRERRPNLVVLNLGSADYAGHSFGPNSPEYRQALIFLDGLIADLLKALDELGIRTRSTIIVSADHGYSAVDNSRLVAPGTGNQLQVTALAARGIEHYTSNTGGTSMGVWLRDKSRLADGIAALRAEPWCEAVYCEGGRAGCDRALSELRAYFPGRSPDLMVDVDDDATVNEAYPGNHGSLRESDMRIPLILSGAGVKQGLTLGRAALVDIAPTIVQLLGLPGSTLRPDGRALVEALVR